MATFFWQGNEACVYGAMAAGARFFAGYPISPSSEIAELCSRLLPELDGIYVQMEDEIASLAAVIGASLGGMRAFTATSGPGFSLMQENLGFAVMAEVPCVIIHAQRFGPATGIATAPAQADVMQARWGSHGDYQMLVLAPSSVQECHDLTVEAFNLAERFRSPVILLTDAALAHLRETVTVSDTAPPQRCRPQPEGDPALYRPYAPGPDLVPAMAAFGDGYIQRVTGLVHDELGYSSSAPAVAAGLVRRLQEKILLYQDELPAPIYTGPEEPDILLVSYGISARAAQAAADRARASGHRVGCLRLRTLWPFPEAAIGDWAQRVRAVLVVEMNFGQLRREVELAVAGRCRVAGVNRYDAEVVTPGEILAALTKS